MGASEIKSKIIVMAAKVEGILKLIDKGFMENKSEFLNEAMKIEHEVNQSERTLTKEIFDMSKDYSDKKELALMAQAIETLERMGDEAANLVERIEIKIQEKLLFSDIGVEEFNETFYSMQRSVSMMVEYLRTQNIALRQKVIDNGFHVKELVEKYRAQHMERLVCGLCTPLGANMYFDMLDFTGNLARHSSNVVKLF